MQFQKLLLVSFLSAGMLGTSGCFDSDDDDPAPAAPSAGVAESLDAAVAYMDESLPEYGSASSVAYLQADIERKLIATVKALSPINTAHAAASAVSGTANLSTHWDTNTSSLLIHPVGGYPGGGSGEVYPGTTTSVDLVDVKEYVGQQLDGSYTRFSGDDTPRPYKPNLFGRFENALEIVRIFGEVFPNGLAAGTEQVSVTEDPTTGDVVVASAATAQTMNITLNIVDISSSSTTYDWAIHVDMGDDDNWMWIKDDATALNFQHLESKSTSESGVNSGNPFDRISLSTLRWDRSTGEMGFEYVSFDDDENTQAYGNIMRAYISGTGGDAYMLSFEGDSSGDATRDSHQAFSLASTGGDDATEALVSVNMNVTGDAAQDVSVNGSLCASMANGDELTAAGACGSLSLGSVDVSTAFPAVVTNLIDGSDVATILTAAGVATWTDTANPDLGAGLSFTDESDMATGYSTVQ